MSKISKLFIAVISSLLLTSCSATNSNPSEPTHTHSFSDSWNYDETYHWHKCSGCDEIKDKSMHTFGTLIVDVPATETEDGSGHYVCLVCPYVKNVVIGKSGSEHTHEYSSDYKYNELTHWRECDCGDKVDEADHVFGANWVIDQEPTDSEKGLRHKECIVCDYETTPEEFDNIIEATGIELTIHSKTISVGETFTLIANLIPQEANSPTISWDSSNNNICSVTDGIVEGHAVGTAIIRAWIQTSTGLYEDTCSITVSNSTENPTVQYQKLMVNSEGTGYVLIGLNEQADEIIVPSVHNDLPVVEIASIYNGSYDQAYQQNYATLLNKITIPSSIQKVQNNAFTKMYQLNVEYSGTKEQWMSIQEGWCFDGVSCTDGVLSDNLEGPELPSDYSNVTVGNFVFNYDGYGTVYLVGLLGNDTNVHIPATYNRYPVRLNITSGEYSARSSVKNLYINSYLNSSLQNFDNLDTITLGYNAMYLSDSVRSDYEHSINILDARYNYDWDENITYYPTKAKHIGVESINPRFKAVDDVVYSKNNEYLLFAANQKDGDVAIPDGTKYINGLAFANCTKLDNATLSETILTIGDEAFDSSSIKNVTLNDGLKSIGNRAFAHTKSLDEIVLPNSLISLGEEAFSESSIRKAKLSTGLTIIEKNTFNDCNRLYEVNIPSSIVEICDGAFANCTFLQNITLPNGLKYIGDDAFRYCYLLTDITIPNTVVAIGNNAFSIGNINITPNLEEIGYQDGASVSLESTSDRFILEDGVLFNKSKTKLLSYNFDKEDTFYEIPDSVHIIESNAFMWTKFEAKDTFKWTFKYVGLHVMDNLVSSLSSYGINFEENIIGGLDYGYIAYNTNNQKENICIEDDQDWDGTVYTSISFTLENTYYSSLTKLSDLNTTLFETFNHLGFNTDAISSFNIDCDNITPISLELDREQRFLSLQKLVIPTSVKFIMSNAFFDLEVYYKGSETDFSKIYLENSEEGTSLIDGSTILYYSETSKNGCWHYINNVPTKW